MVINWRLWPTKQLGAREKEDKRFRIELFKAVSAVMGSCADYITCLAKHCGTNKNFGMSGFKVDDILCEPPLPLIMLPHYLGQFLSFSLNDVFSSTRQFFLKMSKTGNYAGHEIQICCLIVRLLNSLSFEDL